MVGAESVEEPSPRQLSYSALTTSANYFAPAPSSSLSFGFYHVCSWLRSFDEVTLHRHDNGYDGGVGDVSVG